MKYQEPNSKHHNCWLILQVTSIVWFASNFAVNGGGWTDWSACSASCGGGTQSRMLSSNFQTRQESRSCNIHWCPTGDLLFMLSPAELLDLYNMIIDNLFPSITQWSAIYAQGCVCIRLRLELLLMLWSRGKRDFSERGMRVVPLTRLWKFDEETALATSSGGRNRHKSPNASSYTPTLKTVV